MVRPRKHRLAIDIALKSFCLELAKLLPARKSKADLALSLIVQLSILLKQGKCESSLLPCSVQADFLALAAAYVAFYRDLLGRAGLSGSVVVLQSVLLAELYEQIVFAEKGERHAGVFFTPPYLAYFTAERALSAWFATERRLPQVLDPAMGTGMLLLAIVDCLQARGYAREEIACSLYAVEIAKPLRAAALVVLEHCLGGSIEPHVSNFTAGDALLGEWPNCDIVVANPPWEIAKVNSSRAQAHLAAPEESCAIRRNLKERHFQLQSVGDVNVYKLFVERALNHTANCENSVLALITPSGIRTDKGSSLLRAQFLSGHWQCFGFVNLDHAFTIHPSFSYSLSVVSRSARERRAEVSFCGGLRGRVPDFAPGEVLTLTLAELEKLSPLLMLPNWQSKAEIGLNARLYEHPKLSRFAVAKKAGAKSKKSPSPNQEGETVKFISFFRELDLSLRKAELVRADEIGEGAKNFSPALQPVLEGRMVGQYQVFAKEWLCGRGRSANWLARPLAQRRIAPQYYFNACPERTAGSDFKVGFLAIGSADNHKVMQAAILPELPCVSSLTVLRVVREQSAALSAILVGIFNSFVFDYVVRSRITGNNINYFMVQECVLPQALLALLEERASADERLYLAALATLSAYLSYNHVSLCAFKDQFVLDDLKLALDYEALWALKTSNPEGFFDQDIEHVRQLRLLLELTVGRLYGLSLDELALCLPGAHDHNYEHDHDHDYEHEHDATACDLLALGLELSELGAEQFCLLVGQKIKDNCPVVTASRD